jgi:hypothetical protein
MIDACLSDRLKCPFETKHLTNLVSPIQIIPIPVTTTFDFAQLLLQLAPELFPLLVIHGFLQDESVRYQLKG